MQVVSIAQMLEPLVNVAERKLVFMPGNIATEFGHIVTDARGARGTD